jgi:ATP-dependent helicase YprA (DUF1998 family)
MNPIQLTQELQQTLVSYLTTTFDVNRDRKEARLADFIKESLDKPRALFAGPYLELTAPYQTGQSLQTLIAEGVLNPALPTRLPSFAQGKPIPLTAPLYQHQEQAVRRLSLGRNVVVSSGTGSGKTEAFLIPLLNDLISDTTPGVRAVLVYPLNALVNDQLDRLRTLLQGTEITFGRYTSELLGLQSKAKEAMRQEWRESKELQQRFPTYPLPNEVIGRDQIRTGELLPQILITNYAMLEYLLLRPQDNPLFASGLWKFVVLDEAHTYAGAQGIEVGLLLRRLQQRLGHGMQCIATSATLTNDDAVEAARFAEALFGEPFAPEDIIFGQTDKAYHPVEEPKAIPITAYTHSLFPKLLANVREGAHEAENTAVVASYLYQIGLIPQPIAPADRQGKTPAQLLWDVLPSNQDLIQLRQLMEHAGEPLEVTAVAEQLFATRLPDTQQQAQAIHHLIELASMARPDPESASLLPTRYHLFVRAPQGIWACLNPICPDKIGDESWSKLFATPRQTCDCCGSPVYPVVICRTCGQVYLRLFYQEENRLYVPEPTELTQAEKRYVTWKPIQDNLALAEEDDDEEELVQQQENQSKLSQKEFPFCLTCQQEVKAGRCGCHPPATPRHTTLYLMQTEENETTSRGTKTRSNPVAHLNECGRCHSQSLKSQQEVVTEVSMGDLSPLVNLTERLYRALPPASDSYIRSKAGGGRKLLSFYDSRQRAARFAAYVQDVVNQKGYRTIIYEGLQKIAYWADFTDVTQRMLELALTYRILHNDVHVAAENLPTTINNSQRKRLLEKMSVYLLAEISTQLRSRIALESLGLLAVTYGEPEREPDYASLAQNIGLSPLQTRTLVHYLLDGLRRAKIVTLPDGVDRDHELFGRNKFSPRLVKSDNGKEQVLWCGKTPRHGRRRLVQKVLQAEGLASDDTAVIQTLDHIWEWLVAKSDLLDTSRPAEGYQLKHKKLHFQTKAEWYRCNECQRLNCRGDSLPCPHPNCDGRYEPLDPASMAGNFYRHSLRQPPVPMRVEEHTAQLQPEQGRKYQASFKNGDVNMLSCSTTFEMGIDLGDLQAVVMSNIPPTVANYKQRAGRAGRRTSGTAFILAWAGDRPHDQTYFKNPAEIISGRVRIPYLDVDNPIITQRHINALLLSRFLRYCATQTKYVDTAQAFFEGDEENGTPAYWNWLPDWLQTDGELLKQEVLGYLTAVGKTSLTAADAIKEFQDTLTARGHEPYQQRVGYYYEEWQKLHQKQKPGKDEDPELKLYNSLLKRQHNENIIEFFSKQGILPSYSFPLHVVELRIVGKETGEGLRLQRDLVQAIREYAPGQEVVANKRIWQSAGLDLMGKEPKTFAYKLCANCRHLQLETIAGKPLTTSNQPCPVCGQVPLRRSPASVYLEPDGFWASKDSGNPAGQFVDQPAQQIQAALVVPAPVLKKQLSSLLSVGYNRDGSLLHINEGSIKYHGNGFKLCPKCGVHITHQEKACKVCKTVLKQEGGRYMLGFQQRTDTLHLQFSDTPYYVGDDSFTPFWVSLKYALIQGASRALQIERKDIGGVLYPEQMGDSWRPTVVLYDNVPGGAGHVKRIEEAMGEVVTAVLTILDCDCETSCYRCLREYSNQFEHSQLNRELILPYLQRLHTELS